MQHFLSCGDQVILIRKPSRVLLGVSNVITGELYRLGSDMQIMLELGRELYSGSFGASIINLKCFYWDNWRVCHERYTNCKEEPPDKGKRMKTATYNVRTLLKDEHVQELEEELK